MGSTRRIGSAIAVAAIAALAACGKDSPTTPTPTARATPQPTPTPCTQNLVSNDEGGVPSATLVALPFATVATSRIDVILDWTFPESPIGAYIIEADAECNVDQFNARSCPFLGRSEPSATKPKKMSVPDAPAGDYLLLIGNFADKDESVSLQIFESRGSCDPIASAATNGADDEPLRVRSLSR